MKKVIWLLLVVLLMMNVPLYPATHTVSQDGRGEYTSVQAAVNKAKSGDDVVILDFAVYKEQVTIDSSKNRLTLRSENPKLRLKPTIRYQDKTNVGPRTYAESQDQSKITFDMNGATRVLRAKSVTIEGIIFDGGGPAPYGYNAIWENRSPLFSGNAALTLYVAGDVVIRNCEFVNAFYGVYIKDRNEGGIYANANPADLKPQLVVPLSGFGKIGNHLIEKNRIHDNSWGVFIESAWDLGSTIRYNLIYENNIPEDLAEKIDAMDGSDNQWGGAIFLKDQLLTPMAIYNNTFYHNNIILCADWQVGGTNLVFNNIFGKPYKIPADAISAQALDKALPNRVFNCLYACQDQLPQSRSQVYNAGMQDPETNQYVEAKVTYTGYGYVVVMNGLPQLKPTLQTIDLEIPLSSGPVIKQVSVEWAVLPGTVIEGAAPNTPFPKASNNRWFEIKFKSTDPEDADFLAPDWDDSLSKLLIVDQGWAAGGIRDADGSIADIGAIPFAGIPETEIMVKAKDPVFITGGTSAKVNFTLTPFEGTMNNPKIKYVRWIRNIPYTDGIWGTSNISSIPANNIIEVTVPPTPLVIGSNMLTFTIPRMESAYGFFDIIIEGTTADGIPVTTNAGFLPYRAIDYIFDVVIMDEAGTKEITTAQAGQAVQLWITPRRLDGKTFDAEVEKVSVTLSSNFDLLTPGGEIFSIPGTVKGTSKSLVMFTKVPESGFDGVEVSGMFMHPTDTSIFYAIRGSSKDIKIIPGPPEKIAFQDPPSNGIAKVNPGSPRQITVQAYDRYENKVNVATQISVVSTSPDVGTVNGSPATTDGKGLAILYAQVTRGSLDDTFPVVATLLVNNAIDNAKLVVGKPRDRFWIFYQDTAAYDPDAAISACSGIRVPVTIRAGKDAMTVEPSYTNAIAVELSAGMAAYLSESRDDTVKINETVLVKGARVIWLQSTSRNVANGLISVYAKDGTIANAFRENINFIPCNTTLKNAAYFANNGFGSVDRAEIYFQNKLQATEIPDSIRLSWPSGDGEVRVVHREAMMVDPLDSSHVTMSLAQPFAKEITRYAGSNAELGTYYWWNPLTPEASSQTSVFQISDSVGPLIASVLLIERVGDGNDTLYISFTESVIADVAIGNSLTLIKNGGKIQLGVIDAIPQNEQTIKVVVADLKENKPVEGDSLKIASAGPIVDRSKNHAHPENRPVVISLRRTPAEIVSAEYRDRNADGVIDSVTITFNKKTDPAQIAVRLIWEKDSALRSFSATELQAVDGDSGKTVSMVIPDGWFGNAKVNDMTSGDMVVKVTFISFTGDNVRNKTVIDKAAPVLTEVRYCFGSTLNAVKMPDTVRFTLSESATIERTDTGPLLFINDGGSYNVAMNYAKGIIDTYEYIVISSVDAAGTTILPILNDSAWINAGRNIVTDIYGNTQLNPANKRVRLKLEVVSALDLLIGPNPYNATGAQPCYLQVKPTMGIELIEGIKASAVIYDKVGNKVKEFPLVSESARKIIDFKWDGTNMHGRNVGSGTYLCIAKGSLFIGGTEKTQAPLIKYIGIKR
jgi:hypothetical protein